VGRERPIPATYPPEVAGLHPPLLLGGVPPNYPSPEHLEDADFTSHELQGGLESFGALRVARWRVPALGGAKDFVGVAQGWGLADVAGVVRVLRERDATGRDGWDG